MVGIYRVEHGHNDNPELARQGSCKCFVRGSVPCKKIIWDNSGFPYSDSREINHPGDSKDPAKYTSCLLFLLYSSFWQREYECL